MRIVSCAHLVVVRQLHLTVVEVVVLCVLVGDVKCKAALALSQCSTNGITCTQADVDRQRAELTPLVVVHFLIANINGIGCVMVHYRGVGVLRLKNGVRRVRANLRWLQHPLGHDIVFTLAVVGIARNIPRCQLAIGVQRMAEELEAVQIAILGTKGTVVVVDAADVWLVETEIVVVVQALVCVARPEIVDAFAVVDRSLVARGGDVAIEHTVHHHCTYVVALRRVAIVANDAAHRAAACDIGITEAIDDTGSTIEQTYDTTYITATTYTAAKHAAVVDASIACSHIGNGACITTLINACTADDDILDSSPTDIGKKRMTDTNIQELTVKDSCKWVCGTTWIVKF